MSEVVLRLREEEITNDPGSPIERGRRLKVAMAITDLKINEFCQRHKIPASTFFSWESGRLPLSLKGARKICEAFEKEGVICTEGWLLEGSGMPPLTSQQRKFGFHSYVHEAADGFSNLSPSSRVLTEISTFRKLYENSEVLLVEDDSMAPQFSIGDYVGGMRLPEEQIKRANNANCIIEFFDEGRLKRLLRRVTFNECDGLFSVVGINCYSQAADFIFRNIELKSVAPVSWHRIMQYENLMAEETI